MLYEKSLTWALSDKVTLQETGMQSLCFFAPREDSRLVSLVRDILGHAKAEMEEVKDVMTRQKEQQQSVVNNNVSVRKTVGWA